jgi:cytoskeletal protein CcmA (bactofilin family)
VEILASGRLEGDVKAARVVLAEGAYFKGKVEMTGGQA